MTLQFRGCLLGSSTFPKISGIPVCCTESCIILQTTNDTSSEIHIIGELPFSINTNIKTTNLTAILCNLLQRKDININASTSSLFVNLSCMMAVINHSENESYIILIGNNQHGILGLTPSYKQYLDTPLVIPMSKFLNKANRNLNKIVCAEKYSLLLDSDGSVYECGKNGEINREHNESKMDEIENECIASKIDSKWFNNEKIINIECGLIHNIALSETDNVYCWGSNLYHCCSEMMDDHETKSDASESYVAYPSVVTHFVSPLISVKLIDCGLWHSCVMTKMGCIYTWGLNKNGQLGVGKNITHSKIPQLVSFDTDTDNSNVDVDVECITMSSGSRHICVIDTKQRLWGWGYNKFAQIIETKTDIWKPVQIQIENKVNLVKCGHWFTLFS